jgi:magnesium chelatase family protein
VLDALRQPLEAGEIVISRSGMRATFPARFTMVLAANPCPCAKAGSGAAGCDCSPATKRRYLGRLSGPLLDRVDVKVELMPVTRRDMLYDRQYAETSATVAGRVAAARARAAVRLRDTPWRVNAQIPGAELRRSFAPVPGALRSLAQAMELGQVTARGADKIVRVAWSVADLAGKQQPGIDEVNTAIGLWLGVRR